MKVRSYKKAVDQIEWERRLKLSALRDDVLIAVARRLRDFKPNSPSNIKHPWKLADRHSLRAWCPRHDGRWVRLIVRVDEDGQLTFDCDAGCSDQEVRYRIDALDEAGQRPLSSGVTIGAGTHGCPSNVLDARARFRFHNSRGTGDAA